MTAGASADLPPLISTHVPAPLLKKVMEDRLNDVHASLSDEGEPGQGGMRHYKLSSLLLVHAPLKITHDFLVDYPLYKKLIPYFDRADYNPASHLLWLEGGIWGFHLSSRVLFDEPSGLNIHFQIVSGHLTGLSGNFFLEDVGERGTLVRLLAEETAHEFPPKIVMERGAEIVFGFTAQRMRSYIEEQMHLKAGDHDPTAPQPRNHL